MTEKNCRKCQNTTQISSYVPILRCTQRDSAAYEDRYYGLLVRPSTNSDLMEIYEKRCEELAKKCPHYCEEEVVL